MPRPIVFTLSACLKILSSSCWRPLAFLGKHQQKWLSPSCYVCPCRPMQPLNARENLGLHWDMVFAIPAGTASWQRCWIWCGPKVLLIPTIDTVYAIWLMSVQCLSSGTSEYPWDRTYLLAPGSDIISFNLVSSLNFSFRRPLHALMPVWVL